ncbi:SRPBCC family protein [Flavobacterium poyangense]|uniref:SRPBCC family protein n=1 Tax=Flavobacterium poyangense TaxID=2204302 RepID=UPI001420DA3D|nr:SRPBCC domain-containing protein [Flavobacterium sp. JXAS1]
MKTNLLMNFTVDKENCAVKVKREFNAPIASVWAAWTEAEILDQWWAPAPYKSKTKNMDFKVGGHRLYAMVSPEGHENWSLVDYTSISPKTNFTTLGAFCDSEGNINPDFPRSNWSVSFSEQGDLTIVDVLIKHKQLADIEKYLEMGFKEGFTCILENLDKILEAGK